MVHCGNVFTAYKKVKTMPKHKNSDPQSTQKERLKQLSIATIAAIGLIGGVGAVTPPEIIHGEAAKEVDQYTSPLGYYFSNRRNAQLDVYSEAAGQRIVDYARQHPNKAAYGGQVAEGGEPTTGLLSVQDKNTGGYVAVSVIRRGDDEYSVRMGRDFFLQAQEYGRNQRSSVALREHEDAKNDSANTWNVEVSMSNLEKPLVNDVESARSQRVPLEQMEETDLLAMQEVDRIFDGMGL